MAGRRVVDADADGAAHVAGHQTSPPPVPFFHTIKLPSHVIGHLGKMPVVSSL